MNLILSRPQKHVLGRLLAFMACAVLYAVSGCNSGPPPESSYVPTKTVVYPIHLSVLRKGEQIIGTVQYPPFHSGKWILSDMPPEGSLKCVDAAGDHTLATLSDFRGLVDIKSTSDALYFVRFRTSLEMYRYFPGDWMVELLDYSEMIGRDEYGPIPDLGHAGDVGLLDDSSFRHLGFSEASTIYKGGKYAITRWLLVYDLGTQDEYVEKAREFVGQDGDYSITVLQKKDITNIVSNPPQSNSPWWWQGSI